MMSLCTDDIASWVQENEGDEAISWLMILLGVIRLIGDALSLIGSEDWMVGLISVMACTGDSIFRDIVDGGGLDKAFLV